MPDNSAFGPPILNPTDENIQSWHDMQRKQMLAKMLMENVQTSGQTPDNWDSMKVVPHRGLLQNLSPLANALMARKALGASQQAQQSYLQKKYSDQQPQMQPQDSGQTFNGPSGGINVPGQQPPASGLLPQQPPPQNPMLAPGVSRGRSQQLMDLMGESEYGKGVVLPQLMGTSEWQNMLRAYGGNVQAAQAAMQAEAAKKGTIERRPGGETDIPDPTAPGGYRTVRTPNLSPDMEYDRDAQGNLIARNITGAVPALAAQKGAVTAAEEQNKPRMIPMGGGVERLGYPQDVGAGLPPALRSAIIPPHPSAAPPTPAGGGGGPPLPVSGIPSGVPAGSPRYFPQPQQGLPPQTAPQAPQGLQLPQKDATGMMSNNLWPSIPKMQVPQTPGQTSNAYQQEIVKSAAAKHQELVNEYGKQSAAGVQQLEYLTEAEKALPKAETGPMSEWLTHNRGILVQQFPSLAGALGGDKVTPTLELNKQLTNAALQGARSTFGSRMTQNEVKLQTEEMSPSVAMTHDALTSLIHQAKMKAAYAIQQDKDYGEYHAQNGDPNRFESQYNVRRPITRFAAQYDTPQPALERLNKNPHMLPDFKSKFGWDPTQ